MLRKSLVLLDALSGGADAPPSEFRLFKAGVNKTLKGDVVLDAAALQSVLASFAAYGNDLVMDLEHRSLGPQRQTSDTDAMAWFKLAAKGDELWAVDVKWTDEGARRLTSKSQRYISPAVLTDENNRATEIANCALVSMPATLHTPALIAASRKELSMMTPEMIQKIMDLVAAGDLAPEVQAIFQELIAGKTDDQPPAEDPAMAEMTAASGALLSATGAASLADAVKVVQDWAKTAESTKKQSEALALSQRVTLVGELVKLGAETPATAYADAEKKALAPRLLSEDLESMRGRVKALKDAKAPAGNLRPATTEIKTFSASEQAGAKKLGITPEEFVARKERAVRKP